MILYPVCQPTDELEKAIYERIYEDVTASLKGITANSPSQFIINPTPWFKKETTPKGKIGMKPRVINSANYLSKKLGVNLLARGWRAGSKERKIEEQKIDGYIELLSNTQIFGVKPANILPFSREFFRTASEPAAVCSVSPTRRHFKG